LTVRNGASHDRARIVTTEPFVYKLPPLPHQRQSLNRSYAHPGWTFLHEQGTGKTYITINTLVYHYERGRRVDALLVIAPNQVHANWVVEELPKHMPSERAPWRAVLWETGRAKTKTAAAERDALLDFDGVAVLAMNYEAILTKVGDTYARKFLEKRRVLLAMDEADEYLASPGSKRYRRMLAFARRAVMRRPMTGTPVDESPLHIYGLMQAAQEDFWRPEFPDFKAFKNHICDIEIVDLGDDRSFPKIVGYKNLEQVAARIATLSDRCRKDMLGLPPKRYCKHFVELIPEQRRMYEELRKFATTFFPSGEAVTASRAITNMLRRQQVVCGYVPPDLTAPPAELTDEQLVAFVEAQEQSRTLQEIPGAVENRIAAVQYLIRKVTGKTIIWARFTKDIDHLVAAIPGALRYDGTVPQSERHDIMQLYLHDPSRPYLVAHPRAMSRGFTLVNTWHNIYYSNSFSARTRLQSEDRSHRVGLDHSVLYTDLCALRTVEMYIIDRLRTKRSIGQAVTQDPITEWI
jgi:SNF2 family DNA or RNA helicase